MKRKNYKGKRPKTEWGLAAMFSVWFISVHLIVEALCR